MPKLKFTDMVSQTTSFTIIKLKKLYQNCVEREREINFKSDCSSLYQLIFEKPRTYACHIFSAGSKNVTLFFVSHSVLEIY